MNTFDNQIKFIYRLLTVAVAVGHTSSLGHCCCKYSHKRISPYPAKLIYLNFQPLRVAPRYRDPQPKVVQNSV